LFLKSRCEQEIPTEDQTKYQLMAAQRFKKQGEIEEAINLAIQAGADEQAAAWMEETFPQVIVGQGKHITYGHWFDALTKKARAKFPRMRIGYIWSLTARRQYLAVAEQVQWLQTQRADYDKDIQQEIDRITSLIYCAMKGLQDDADSCAPKINEW
jgi:ATP/maltotriose-dependent transcriptional regulator MalT